MTRKLEQFKRMSKGDKIEFIRIKFREFTKYFLIWLWSIIILLIIPIVAGIVLLLLTHSEGVGDLFGILGVILGIGIVLSVILLLLNIKYILNREKHEDILPINVINNKGWKDIVKAFTNLDKLQFGYWDVEVGEDIKKLMFLTSTTEYIKDEDERDYYLEDKELARAYNNILTSSPMLERLAYLLVLDEDKILGFNRRPEEDRELFLEPIKEFRDLLRNIKKYPSKRANFIEEQLGSSSTKMYYKSIDEEAEIILNQVFKRKKELESKETEEDSDE